MSIREYKIWYIMVGFINIKFAEKLQNNIILTNIVIFIIHIYLLSFSSCNPSQCLPKPANKIKKIIFINKTVKFKLKLNYRLSLYMLSTNWASIRWGITAFAPCTNIKKFWSASHSCASNIRNYMSYANYAATNRIHVFSCIFINVI